MSSPNRIVKLSYVFDDRNTLSTPHESWFPGFFFSFFSARRTFSEAEQDNQALSPLQLVIAPHPAAFLVSLQSRMISNKSGT